MLIDVVDPDGRRIQWDQKAWDKKSIKWSFLRDPWMPEEVRALLSTPWRVTDNHDETGKTIAYFGAAPYPFRPTDLFRIVVRRASRTVWWILTVHPVTDIPPGDVILREEPHDPRARPRQ